MKKLSKVEQTRMALNGAFNYHILASDVCEDGAGAHFKKIN